MSTVLAVEPSTVADKPIRVMVVDDSIVVRRLLTRWISVERDMMIAACLRTGREAVDQIETCDPDVVVLDVDMPELDGISALPILLKKKPEVVVIMASTLTRRSAEISLRALSLGAADYVPKPEVAPDVSASAEFQRELIEKIRNLGRRDRRLARSGRLGKIPGRSPAPSAYRLSEPPHAETAAFSLRPFSLIPPRVLLIGSSTGGPQALTTLIGHIGAAIDRAPILITQHMPPTFTTVLAEHLSRACRRNVREAEHEEAIVAGRVYVAPGGRHMRVTRGRDSAPAIALGDDAPINFCKPSVDPLLSSASEVWGPGSLALVLTGMGTDGTRGAAAIAAAGGNVIAQDEATSVVWGMPRSVAQAGLCAAVLPLDLMAGKINRLFGGERA
jgi:two-component system, chemotaxis family, protein-glutamate methylesterase/glutaminase